MTRTEWREWLQTVGIVLIPVTVAIMGNTVARSNATREVNAKMVEIAAQVLTSPVNDSTRSIRLWATKVLQRHSDVPFPVSAFESYRLILAQLPGVTPISIEDIPYHLMVSPKKATILSAQQMDFVAVSVTAFGDTALISDLTWTASGGRITASSMSRRRHYARFKAGTATGDFIVTARSASKRLADSAFVHIQPR